LNEQQFTNLLIDIHVLDGTLATGMLHGSNSELRNYEYYNAVFARYGIDRADFDSCMRYYSARTAQFSKMYDRIVDSLSKRLTQEDRVLNELRVNDSINYFPRLDTIVLDTVDPVQVFVIDSIVPGEYRFSVSIQFDTLDMGKENRITAWFLSEDGADTLKVRKVKVYSDTLVRKYSWTQYADSLYTRLEIRIPDCDNAAQLKKQKKRRGRIWGAALTRPYISRKTEERLKGILQRTRQSGGSLERTRQEILRK
jgi:hypothetical protein